LPGIKLTDTPSGVRRFRGWIPTVSGRLSFSVFGNTANPTQAFSANVADRETRYLASYQVRDTSDVLLPARRIFGPLLFKTDGQFCFAFYATTEDIEQNSQEYLIGKAFMFYGSSRAKEIVPEIQVFQDYLRQFFHDNPNSLKSYCEDRFDLLMNYSEERCVFSADIRICRTGTTDIFIKWPLRPKPGAPQFPADAARLTHMLAAQIFFFLKDLGHRHQHHDQKTDTIVDLYEIDTDDDTGWRRSTLYNIYRKVIIYKRDPHISIFDHCLGLIAYADSFYKISLDEIGRESRKYLPKYYSKETIESIRSTQARAERQFANAQSRSDTIRNIILGVSGIFIGYMQLLQIIEYKIQMKPHWLIVKGVEFLMTAPLITVAIVGVGGWSILYIVGGWLGSYRRFKVWMMTILQVLPRSWTIGIWFILFLIFASMFATSLIWANDFLK
jgi:hypothetical protein